MTRRQQTTIAGQGLVVRVEAISKKPLLTNQMKTLRIAVGLFSLIAASSASAQTLAKWTFELNTPADVSNAATLTAIPADIGTGTASGIHATNATDWSTPSGNGSANSLSANEWLVGDYFQFSLSTVGYTGLKVSWAQVSSSTGPGEFKLAYQVNGGGFTDYANYTVLPNQAGAPGLGTWSSVTENVGYNYSFDLSALTAVDNAAAVDFRLIMVSTADATPPGTVANTGTSRVDNFEVAVVPEPSSFALVGFGVLALVARRRK